MDNSMCHNGHKVSEIFAKRIRWVWISLNASLGKFLGDLVTIITHRIIHPNWKSWEALFA
jgi:hypothetical protein